MRSLRSLDASVAALPQHDVTWKRLTKWGTNQGRFLLLIGLSLLLAWILPDARAATFLSSSPPAFLEGPLQISAWMPTSWDGESARASFQAHTDVLATISPYWYGVAADGSLSPFAGARDTTLRAYARDRGVRFIPTVSNQGNGDRIHAILIDPTLAARHRQAIVEDVLRYQYDGIDLDYENLWAEDRDRYTAWVRELAQALHGHEKDLTVTVQAKTFDADGWNGPGALDYGALAAVADELRVMTYGWCWRTGCVGSDPPGPIAPIHWMQRVIAYAKTRVPGEKIVLGVHLYGYDWTLDQGQRGPFLGAAWEDATGQALVWTQAEALRAQHHAALQWWETDEQGRRVQEPWFTYDGTRHAVTFANADSVIIRARLAQTEGLRGIIFWRLGGEDPALWDRLPPRTFSVHWPLWMVRK